MACTTCEIPVRTCKICGNYRRERIDVDTDTLMELIEAAGLIPEEALRRVHVLTASSADQQGFLVDELEALMRRETNISLVIVSVKIIAERKIVVFTAVEQRRIEWHLVFCPSSHPLWR